MIPSIYIHTQAGQTKFKTAAVEYIRALGLKPTVIASSNHLGTYACVRVCLSVSVPSERGGEEGKGWRGKGWSD